MNTIDISKVLSRLLDEANDYIIEILKLEESISEYIANELIDDGISEKFIKYSVDKIDLVFKLLSKYNTEKNGEIYLRKKYNLDVPNAIKLFWNRAFDLIKDEAKEQELLANYILEYTEGKNLTETQKEIIKKTFKLIKIIEKENKE